jgi:hypothetical protein
MKAKTQDFVIVTKGNLKDIAQRLQARQGRILIAGGSISSGHDWFDQASLSFYDRPYISMVGIPSNPVSISTRRGSNTFSGEHWQTGWQNDRHYLLRRKLAPTGDHAWDTARTFFEGLEVGEFEFKIGFESVVSRTFPWEDIVLFIPNGKPPKKAFVRAFEFVTEKLDRHFARTEKGTYRFRFEREHIEAMVTYVVDDLVTGKVFKHNVDAGAEADMMTGFAPKAR